MRPLLYVRCLLCPKKSICISLQVPHFLGEGMGQDDMNDKGQNWNSNPPVCIVRFQVGKSWDTQINSLRGVFLKRGGLKRGGQSLN